LVSGFNEMLAEIERQNKDLIQAKEQAERSAKIKEQFLANMSHEIRTPMNGMKPFIELMLETELNQQQRKYMEIIKSSSDNLLVIINDILDITKIESGHLVFEEDVIELNTLIEKVIENQRVLFEQKKIQVYKKIAPDVPPTFLGDPVRLSQILMNLFSNAVKFTEQGSITIGANLLESTKDSVLLRFYVKDTGIGIPEDKLDYIFNIFTQAHSSTTRKYGGTGLGLSICKQLVEMQKGKIWVESKLNEGSTFYFQIYFKNHKQREKPKRPKLPLSLDISDINLKNELKEYFSKNISLPILLAEDNETNQEVVKEFFKKINENISVVVAQNGKIVLEMLEKNDFSLILMDLHMPELDGYDTASAIRNHPTARYKNIPIIAMTASPSKEKAEQCLSIGMDDYISKPINMNEFADKLLRVLKLKKV
ncbi:MAG: ATP-binding protein, partial [Flammeovirgaceae bacterium]|nr:ATP-binding protein [Flammeovirgaceae bacterium]MDW8286858.1 ATP-binding protein [Flammeovirgaceae bacterium]